jgi:hypothetical protein
VNTAKNEFSNNSIIFIYISLSVFSATLISHFIPPRADILYFYLLIWLGSFSIFFFIFKTKIIKALYVIRNKIKKSTGWPTYIKIINGLCWAGPFGLGALIPPIHEYLILAGIGLGNVSTFIIFLLKNKIKNIDQLIVGIICLFSIILVFFLLYENVIDKTSGEFLARILISIAYGIGGLYSAIIKPE